MVVVRAWELASQPLLVAAIVGVLWFYDGKRQPEHIVVGITLKTYFAVFTAISKAVTLPVSEAIE